MELNGLTDTHPTILLQPVLSATKVPAMQVLQLNVETQILQDCMKTEHS